MARTRVLGARARAPTASTSLRAEATRDLAKISRKIPLSCRLHRPHRIPLLPLAMLRMAPCFWAPVRESTTPDLAQDSLSAPPPAPTPHQTTRSIMRRRQTLIFSSSDPTLPTTLPLSLMRNNKYHPPSSRFLSQIAASTRFSTIFTLRTPLSCQRLFF